MAQTIERIRIALWAVGRNIINRFRKQKSKPRVLIVFQQIFGDSVIFSAVLQGYEELYVKQKKVKVTLLCLPAIKKFMEEVTNLPSSIEIETVDFKRLVNDFEYFKSVVATYDNSADLCIVPGSSLSASLLSTALLIKRRVRLSNVYPLKWPLHFALFDRLAYTDSVVPELGTMMIQRHRAMLRYLGLNNYQGMLPELKKQSCIIDGDYCVICPGASVSLKRWPSQRFAEILDYLVETFGWDIHVCGGADEEADCNRMISFSRYPEKVISHVGKTTFSEWSSIIEYAQLVIGNDSATLHIAAGHRVKAICIAGVYDKFQFFPYRVDRLAEGDILPETVYEDKSCEYCRTKGYYAGYGNNACKKAVKAGECTLCIKDISVEKVKEVINKVIKQ